jgi:hypothetical protein
MKKTKYIIWLLLTFVTVSCYGQYINRDQYTVWTGRMGVGINAATVPTTSTHLQLGDSATTRALLLPRVQTTAAVTVPRQGMFVYSISDSSIYYRDRVSWIRLSNGSVATSSWNASMAVSPDILSSYTSNFNNNPWNLQNIPDFTIHSDAGGTTRLKLSAETSELLAPDGIDGFIVDNDSVRILGVQTSSLAGLYFPLINPVTGALTQIAAAEIGNEIDVWLIAGQSNAVGNSGSPLVAPTPTAGTAFQFYNNNISAAVEPIGNSDGSAWPAFAMSYYKLTGRKICFVPAGVNGTSMTAAAQIGFGTWDTTGTLYATSVLKADSAMSALTAAGYAPVFKGVLWCQGETDADGINRGLINQAAYSAAFAKLIKNYRLEFGKGISFNIFRTGFRTDTLKTGYLQVQSTQVTLANPDSLTNVVYWNAPFFPDRSLMVDVYHYTQAGYNEMGRIGAEEIINSMSNNFQTQSGNLYFKKGKVGIGDIIPASPLHVYNTGTASEIRLEDSLNDAVRMDIVNDLNGASSGSGIRLHNSLGLRAHIVLLSQASSLESDALWIFNNGNVLIGSDNGIVNLYAGGTATPNNAKLRIVAAGNIGIGSSVTPNASAQLDVQSTTRGLRIPTMTAAQMLAISTPATGLLVYNTDSLAVCQYNGTVWRISGSNGAMFAREDSRNNTAAGMYFSTADQELVIDSLLILSAYSYADADSYSLLQMQSTENSLRYLHNGFDNFISIGAGAAQIQAEDSIRLIHPATSASLTGYNLVARNTTTGSIVDYTGSVGGSASISALTAAAGTNTINNAALEQEWQWNTLAGTEGLHLTSTSTAAASDAQILFRSSLSGANATAGQFTAAIAGYNTHTGSTSENVGGYFSASGGTYNYDAWFNSGAVSFGGASIAAGATDATGAVQGSFFRQTDNSWGGLTFYPNANYTTKTTFGSQGIQTNQDLLFVVVGGDLKINATRTMVGTNTDATSTLQSNGSFAAAYVAKTANYTAAIGDYTIECTANTFQITLPTAVGISGRVYNIVNSGAGTITIGTTSSQTFVNVVATPTTLTLAAVGWYSVQSNGANWLVISN